MNKKKLKCIEEYIFAKTLNLIAKNTIVSRENTENFNLVSLALNKSEQLLEESILKINQLKLNDISFLLLKRELESAEIFRNQERNINKIKEMLTMLNA